MCKWCDNKRVVRTFVSSIGLLVIRPCPVCNDYNREEKKVVGEWMTEEFWNLHGTYLKKFRINKNMTQSELARIVGCQRVTISRIETGHQKPSIELAYSLANALGIPFEKLFYFKK